MENQILLDPEFIIKESIGVLKSEMNSLGLSSCQQSVCKEVRQKGRNLIHAQSHRRAKQNEIEKLQVTVENSDSPIQNVHLIFNLLIFVSVGECQRNAYGVSHLEGDVPKARGGQRRSIPGRGRNGSFT